MGFRKLCGRGGTPMVTLDHAELAFDGVLDMVRFPTSRRFMYSEWAKEHT